MDQRMDVGRSTTLLPTDTSQLFDAMKFEFVSLSMKRTNFGDHWLLI